jgi:hypothetical protein
MRKIKNSRIGDKKERYKAMALAISTQPNILFDVEDPAKFIAEYNNFLSLDAGYSSDKLEAQKHNNLRHSASSRLAKRARKVTGYLKVKFDSTPKALGDWGINQAYSIQGKLIFPSTNSAKEELFANIFAKHLLDDVDSPLTRFDMPAFADDLQKLTDEKASFKAKQSQWRSKSMYRKYSIKKLDKMMSRIARDLISREDIIGKDLELWGYLLAEDPLQNNEDELALAS